MRGFYITALMLFMVINARSQTFTWNGLLPIYDLQTDTVFVQVNGLPNNIDTTFGIAHVCFDITHTYVGDLAIRIVSPTGSSVNLVQTKGGSGDNYIGTCVGVDGTSFSNTTAPYTGIFVPVGDLSALNDGQNPNGNWMFIVSDLANADTGSVHSVGIVFTNNPPRAATSNPPSALVPTGNYVWPGVVCPGGANSCDLLPDMTASAKEIQLNHNETPGFLYISNATPNIGYGSMEIYGIDSCFCGNTPVPCGTVCPGNDDLQHVIKQRVYQKQPGTDTLTYYDRTAGRMTYHANHGHLHVDNWSSYTLRTATANPDARTWPIVGTGTKQSFCLINLGNCSSNVGQCKDNLGNNMTTFPNHNLGFHTGCGMTQGIYVGNFDVYSISLNDPIPLNNVCNGNYYIVSITDPNDNFLESDENNNWVAVPITLTQQSPAPSISAAGSTTICQGDSVILSASVSSNYSWSTGETTQSIVVKTPGAYTVSSDCGTSVSTSSPVNVSFNEINISATSIPSAVCSGDAVQLSSTATSNTLVTGPTDFSSNQQVYIPDNNSAGVTSPIVVSGINPATLNSNSVISVKINITHTYDGDLRVSLIAPSGNTIILSNRRGGGGNDFINTIFSMSATSLIASGSAPFTGTYKPDESFALLTGNVNGTWMLKVQDLAGVDTGRIRDWTITLDNLVQETFSYSWSSFPAGFISTDQNPVVNPLSSVIYEVEATSNVTGCKSVSTIPVEVISIASFSPLSGPPSINIIVNGEGFTGVTGVTIGGDPCVFSVLNDGQLSVTSPDNSGGPICISTANCTIWSPLSFTTITSGVNINLKVFIQGFYTGNGMMEAVVNPGTHPLLCDTVILKLREQLSPFTIAYTQKSTINTTGEGLFEFPVTAGNNNYYLVLHHRNAIETWSSVPVLVTNNMTYDFTDAISKAYGSNLYEFGDGNFGLYSGDVSDASNLGMQDGVIESQDYLEVENAVNGIMTGYVLQDLTGDGVAESFDYLVIENNVSGLIFVIRP